MKYLLQRDLDQLNEFAKEAMNGIMTTTNVNDRIHRHLIASIAYEQAEAMMEYQNANYHLTNNTEINHIF